MRLQDIDVYDPGVYAEGVPHDRFALLRERDPVFWQAMPDGGGYWCLTRHADVLAASEDPGLFSAERGGIVLEDLPEEQLALVRSQLLAMDPPRHKEMRRRVLQGLTPAMVGRMEPWLRARSRAIVEAALGRERCDFVRNLASELPLQVICELLGVPESDRAWVLETGDRIIGRDDPELAASADEAGDASVELGTYGFRLATERKDGEGADLISALLNARADDRLDEVEFAGLFVQIIVAGNETTRTLLAGGLLALVEHPEAWSALAADPGGLPLAVEEMLRWVTPVHYFRRTATRDTTLRGKRIREGDRVALQYSSANFDEAVFQEPTRFDVRRQPNPHLAFGWGEHFCLGAKLARLEARVFFEELLARVARVELEGPVQRLRSNLTNSYRSIPVALHPR